MVISSVQLPFQFDANRLKADLEKIAPVEWTPHFNTSDYEGRWSGVSLRSAGGNERNIIPDPMANSDFQDTPLLDRCTYVREVIGTFQCPQKAVRFLKLHAGSSIREHTDRDLAYEEGEVRLHIPIITSPEVAFYLNGNRIKMNEGECWYTNVNLPHRVENNSRIDRVHLVLDCEVSTWLRSVLETAFHTDPSRSDQSDYATLVLLPDTISSLDLLNCFSKFAEISKSAKWSVRYIIKGNRSVLSWTSQVGGLAREWSIDIRPERKPQFEAEINGILRPHPDKERLAGFRYTWSLMLESADDPESEHIGDFRALLHYLSQAIRGIVLFDPRTATFLE